MASPSTSIVVGILSVLWGIDLTLRLKTGPAVPVATPVTPVPEPAPVAPIAASPVRRPRPRRRQKRQQSQPGLFASIVSWVSWISSLAAAAVGGGLLERLCTRRHASGAVAKAEAANQFDVKIQHLALDGRDGFDAKAADSPPTRQRSELVARASRVASSRRNRVLAAGPERGD